MSHATPASSIFARAAQSWRDRLATWQPAPNPYLPRCRCCGVLPLTRRDYCAVCGAPV